MRYAIISDIHANESALRHALEDATAQGAETVVCLGDVVGYGPLPKETLALVRRSAAITLAGNHDDAVSKRQDADGFIDLAGEAVKRHREALDTNGLSWLRTLPYDCRIEGAIAAHGDFTDPKSFNYIDDEASAEANFAATDAQLMFVGHTHVPGFFLTGQSGKVYRLNPQDFSLEDGKRYIVNPGSVGYPRESDGTCHSSYVLYDTSDRSVRFRLLPFSVASVMQRGQNPRRRLGLIVASIVLVLAALVGALIARSRMQPEIRTVTVEKPMPADRPLVLAEKSLTLGTKAAFVRGNLRLEKGSAPVTLQVAFKSSEGKVLGESTTTVKGSARQRIKVPGGAISAHFTVSRQRTGETPKIRSFAPAAN